MSARAPILPRILAILAACCLVGAFALALLYPPTMSLQRLLMQLDQRALIGVQDWVREHWGESMWVAIFVPILARPGWLMPLACSLIFGGLAATSLGGRRMPGSPRWRN